MSPDEPFHTIAAVLALILWTMGTLGRNLTDTMVTRADHTLS
jgi:hypothetical protein